MPMPSLTAISPEQVTAAVIALFDPTMPTAVRCMTVLRGGTAGRCLG